jgi:hypothetical protein
MATAKLKEASTASPEKAVSLKNEADTYLARAKSYNDAAGTPWVSTFHLSALLLLWCLWMFCLFKSSLSHSIFFDFFDFYLFVNIIIIILSRQACSSDSASLFWLSSLLMYIVFHWLGFIFIGFYLYYIYFSI